jgi:hypothetical protein
MMVRSRRRGPHEEQADEHELIYVTFVTAFIVLVIFGHVLLVCAILKCLREGWIAGRRNDQKRFDCILPHSSEG